MIASSVESKEREYNMNDHNYTNVIIFMEFIEDVSQVNDVKIRAVINQWDNDQ